MATFTDYVNSFQGGLNVDPSFATVSPDWASAAGFAAPPASYVTDGGGGPNPIVTNTGQQMPQSMIEQAANVVYGLANGLITESEARTRLAAIGLTSSSAQQFIDQGLQQKAAFAARGGTVASPTTITSVPTASPTFVGEKVGGAPVSGSLLQGTPEARRQADLLSLIQDPRRAFEQLFDVSRLQPGSQLNRSLFNFLGAPAQAGFRLSPFLRSNVTPENLGSFQLADFVGGGLPSQEEIVHAFRQASGDPAGMQGTKRVRAMLLQDPEMQEEMFETAFQPWLARSGPGFRNELSRFLGQQFNAFRQANPGLNFLQELGQGRPVSYTHLTLPTTPYV